jgi:5-hydroxyisourate hydrolase
VGKLTTHVLDTAHGKPGAGVRIDLYRLDGDAGNHLASVVTNADGRTDKPLAEGEAFSPGTYELVFHVGDYFRREGVKATFIDLVPVRFGIDDGAQHYHVPLLCSPWSYSTYRGS